MKAEQVKPKALPFRSNLLLFLGPNIPRIIAIYAGLGIIFLYFFDQLDFLYSSVLAKILNQAGFYAVVAQQQLGVQLWLLSNLSVNFINLSPTASISFPILMLQKIQFPIVMMSIALGLHLAPRKKLNYLFVAVAYWGFIMFQDVFTCIILSIMRTPVDSLYVGAALLTTSTFAGSVIFLYTIFHTSSVLPKPVKIKPKIKRDVKRYYYVLGVSIFVSVAMIYFLIFPLVKGLEFNLAVTLVVLMMFNLFRTITNIVGYVFFLSDKPIRSKSYTPLVTVIIPAFNEERNVADNIASVDLAAQSYKGQVELIVVDDNSTDSTHEIAEASLGKCKYLTEGRVILNQKKGKPTALNEALKYAKGELVLNLDADSRVDKDVLVELVPYFADPEVGGVSCFVNQRSEDELLRKMFVFDLLHLFGFTKPSQQGFDSVMVIVGSQNMYRKNIILELGGWGEMRGGEDGDMTLRVARYGYKIVHYKERALGTAVVFPELPRWFMQRTRWMTGFFYSHARNRGVVSDMQGARGIFVIPWLYFEQYNRFTTMLFIQIILVMAIVHYLYSGITSVDFLRIALIIVNPLMILLVILCLYYRRIRIMKYLFFYIPYSYLQMYCSLRALIIVIGEEKWQTMIRQK